MRRMADPPLGRPFPITFRSEDHFDLHIMVDTEVMGGIGVYGPKIIISRFPSLFSRYGVGLRGIVVKGSPDGQFGHGTVVPALSIEQHIAEGIYGLLIGMPVHI